MRRLAPLAAACCLAAPLAAQEAGDTPALTTSEEVRTEISEAFDAIADYTAQERDEALADAEAALADLDAEIARREQALRENWSEMSASARARARDQLAELRAARNRLGERYGALQAGAESAWDELKEGFGDAWDAFSAAWEEEDGA